MRIVKVRRNNRKRAFEVTTSRGEVLLYPYARLALKPSVDDPVQGVGVDRELASKGFTYVLASGKEDSVLLDQVLDYHKDPEFLRRMLLHRLTVEARAALVASGLRHREVIRRMRTSPAQFYRLIDPAYAAKSIDQMIRLFAALDRTVEIDVTETRPAAA